MKMLTDVSKGSHYFPEKKVECLIFHFQYLIITLTKYMYMKKYLTEFQMLES